MELLLQAGVNVNRRDRRSGGAGDPALVTAASGGHAACVKLLVLAGVDLNATSEQLQETALVKAVKGEHTECITALLEAGADVNVQNAFGYTALYYAALEGREDLVRELVASHTEVRDSPALLAAVQYGHYACVRALLEAGADVNTCGKDGSTGLMVAVRNADVAAVKLLLRSGASVNLICAPSLLSVKHKRPRPDSDASPTSKTPPRKPIDTAVHNGDDVLVKILRAAGETPLSEPDITTHGEDTLASMKQLCRAAIRDHVIGVNREGNLFQHVTKLGITHQLQSFLLFDVSLDEFV